MVDQVDNERVLTLDELRGVIVPYVEQRDMRWARVFGSYARGEADGASDVDVLVDKGDNGFLALGGLAERIWDATGKRPDVVDVSQLLPGPFREEVLREAVAL